MPKRPAKGARIVFFSTIAACCATCDVKFLRLAASVSSTALLMACALYCAESRRKVIPANSAWLPVHALKQYHHLHSIAQALHFLL